MSNFIQWTDQAFRELERLPEKLAFEIIRQTDLLATFPEMGPDLGSQTGQLAGFRWLVINRRWRVIYQYERTSSDIRILAIQNCRQKLPTQKSLRKRKREIS